MKKLVAIAAAVIVAVALVVSFGRSAQPVPAPADKPEQARNPAAAKEPWANLWFAEVEGRGENDVWDSSIRLHRRDSL